MDVDQLFKRHGISKGKVDIERLIDLLKRGDRIAAVRLVVDQSGSGLKVSKDLCDDLRKGLM